MAHLGGVCRFLHGIFIFSFVFGTTALPFNESLQYDNFGTVKQRALMVPLRILTLGASIAYGVGSSTGDGFRRPLRDALRFDGWEVDMVGTRTGGVMVDWDNEATPGFVLTQIRSAYHNSAGYKPNVVVINGGTNDADYPVDPSTAGERMRDILNDIWNTSGMANTCVMLSTLIPSTDPNGVVNRITINAQYRDLVTELSGTKCIYLADMDPPSGAANGWISTSADMISDGIHPNDSGHRKMASVFHVAITKAFIDGKIVEASDSDPVGIGGCAKTYANGIYAGALTQTGSGIDDGIYYHNSVEMGTLLTLTDIYDRDQWFFARLYGRQYDDLLEWFQNSAGESMYGVWKNFGGGKYTKIGDMDPDLNCIPRGVWFLDMNADGYDDIVCIDPAGNAYLSINQGDGTDSKPPTFKRVSDTALIMSNQGYAQDRVRMGDIDGDGRGDYLIVDDSGNVWAWRNGWVDDIPQYWQALGMRFPAKGMGDIRGVRFEDINGDGRDDWLWVSDVGATTTYTNARSCLKGVLGDGLNVAWRQGFLTGQTSGPTHLGMGAFVTDTETYLRDRIHFARVYGEPEAFGLLGKQDYVFMQHTALDNGQHKFEMKVWKNVGSGGTKLKADGNKYCNMKGHANGAMDYVWTLSTGAMTIYPNAGKTSITSGESWWSGSEAMWDPYSTIGKDLNRRDLHLADWDGDGACDIIWTDPDNNNHVSVWLNGYKSSGSWNWVYLANPAPELSCNQKRGLGIYDIPVRMASISGTISDLGGRRADYLCVEPNGHVTGFIQDSAGHWSDVGQIKYAIGKDRANLQWADVNGDGKDDMIWVDKFTGDGSVYYNQGPADPAVTSGSSFSWLVPSGPSYAGNHAGTCMFYPDMDGNGRADMHSIIGTFTNQAETWLNPSCSLSDRTGDDAGWGNPNLPTQPSDDGSTPPEIVGWRDVSCTNPAVTDAGIAPSTRWSEVKAEQAWIEAIADWTSGSKNLKFPPTISNFFHATEQMNCETTTSQNGCNSFALCQDAGDQGPAGFLIMNSFTALNNAIWNYYDAIGRAQTIITDNLKEIADTFNDPLQEDLNLKILLDILGLSFALFAAPMWNSVLKKVTYLGQNGNTLGTLKDSVNPLVSNGVTITKDAQGTEQSFDLTSTLEENLAAIVSDWYASITDYQAWLFSGADDSIAVLHQVITNGGILGDNYSPMSDLDIQNLVYQAIYSVMIPLIWQSLSQTPQYPLVITTGIPCTTTDFDYLQFHVRETDKDNIQVCYNDNIYFLVGAIGAAERCVQRCTTSGCTDEICDPNPFSPLQGASSLDGSNYGGLTLTDIVAGALATWNANGQTNNLANSSPTDILDPLDTNVVDDLYTFGPTTAGVVKIPVCTGDSAYDRWYNGPPGGNYPCPG